MYQSSFYISEPKGNNAFSYKRRRNKKIFIPALKEGTFEDVRIGDEVVFEDYDEQDNLRSCLGLKNFVRTEFQGTPVFIFDNHNHAFYFWHEARKKGIIQDTSTLVHFDQHSDMREPETFLSPDKSKDLSEIFRYLHSVLNVGNFIVPAQKTGLIKNVIQIRGEDDLQKFSPSTISTPPALILDIDLDFFAPEMDYIDFNLAKQKILAIAQKSAMITIATSPFFIDQERAIAKLNQLFTKRESEEE